MDDIDETTVYDFSGNYDNYTNILFVDSSIMNYELFVSSVNSHTYPLIVNTNHEPDALSEFLNAKFPNVNRIGIASHGPLDPLKGFQIPYFIGGQKYFQYSDLTVGATTYSANVEFVRQLIVSMGLTRIDFLGCNLLRIPKFKTYFDILKKDNPNVTIGASNDKTGNIKYGGNWTMENTNDNIKHEYFTDAIGAYNNLLASTTYTTGGYTYTFQYTEGNSYCTLNAITPLTGNLVMADSLQDANGNSYNITHLGPNIFIDNTLTSVDVCTHSTTVDNATFQGLTRSMPTISFARTSLTQIPSMANGNYVTITLPSTATRINSCYNCTSLTTINGFSNITYVGGNCFHLCASFNPPSISNITTFGWYSFQQSGITSFVPGSGTTDIGRESFKNCTNLSTIDLSALDMNICTIGVQCFYGSIIQSVTLPTNMTTMPDQLLAGCGELLTVDLSGVTAFAQAGYDNRYHGGQFLNCTKLHTITNFPQNLTEITVALFKGCEQLSSFDIPSSVTTIGVSAFMSCKSITTMVVPSQVDTLFITCFDSMDGLSILKIPRTVKYIKKSGHTGLKTLDSSNYHNDYWNICNSCENLETLIIDYDIDVIGRNIASLCPKLKNIEIGPKISSIATGTFTLAGFTGVNIYGANAETKRLVINSNISLPTGNGKLYGYNTVQATAHYQAIQLVLRDNLNEYEYQGVFSGEGDDSDDLQTVVASFDSTDTVNWISKVQVPTPTASASGVSKFTSFAGTIDLTDTSIVGTTTTEKRDYTFNQMKKLVDRVSDSSGFASKNFFELDNVGQLPGLKRAYANLKVFKPNTEVDTSEISSGAAIYTPLDAGSYIIIPEGPSSSVKWKITKTSETAYTRQLTTGGDITTHTKGDEFQLGTATIILGSVELSYSGVNIVLTAFNTTVSMSTNAIVAGDWSISGDATITLNNTVPKSELQNTFFYHLTGSSIHYYVDSAAFTNASTVLNPKNGKIVTTGDGAYVSGDSIGEDYLRDTARQLFGTYLGADLFTNEDGVVEHINSKCDDVASTIMGILTNVNITSNSLTNTDSNLNNAKYLSDSTADTNICRELVNQMHNSVGTRFQDLNTTVYNGMSGYYYVPFQNGDVISYKVTLEAPSDQHTVVATGASALTARTYVVNLNVVD